MKFVNIFCKMNPAKIEEFIEMVRFYPEIYDSLNKNYKNQKRKDNIWKEIANAFNFESAKSAKKEWKNLRDGYREAKKRLHNRSGSCRKVSKTWRYLPLLEFLDDHSRIIHHDSNLGENTESQDEEIDNTLEETGYSDNMNMSMVDETADPLSVTSKCSNENQLRKRSRKDSPRSTDSQSSNEMSQILEVIQTNNAEYQKIIDKQQQKPYELKCFFDAMYETVAKLKPCNQRRVKRQIFNVISEIEEEEAVFLENENVLTLTSPVTPSIPSAEGSKSNK